MKTTVEHAIQTQRFMERDALPPTEPKTEDVIILGEDAVVETPESTLFLAKDEGYPLAHRMVYDLVQIQNKALETYSVNDLGFALRREKELVHHVYDEIRSGFLAETPLDLEHDPSNIESNSFVYHVAREYVRSMTKQIREYGPDPEVITVEQPAPDFVNIPLFEDIDDIPETTVYPDHISVIPVENLSELQRVESETFHKLTSPLERTHKRGSGVLRAFEWLFHSGEIPTVGPTGTKVIEVVEQKQVA